MFILFMIMMILMNNVIMMNKKEDNNPQGNYNVSNTIIVGTTRTSLSSMQTEADLTG